MSSLVTTFENWEEFSILGLPRLSICKNYSKMNTAPQPSKPLLNSRNHFIIMWKFMCQNTLRAANICAERLKYGTDTISMWERTSKQNAFRFWFQKASTNNRLPQNFCCIKRKQVKFYSSLWMSTKHRKWPRKSYIDEECTLSPLEVYVTRCS